MSDDHRVSMAFSQAGLVAAIALAALLHLLATGSLTAPLLAVVAIVAVGMLHPRRQLVPARSKSLN